MINCTLLGRKLRDELTANLPKEERGFVRHLLNTYTLSPTPTDDELRLLGVLEKEATTGQLKLSAVALGSILYYARFFRKVERGGVRDHEVLTSFHERQKNMRGPRWREDTYRVARHWSSLVFGESLPSVPASFKHGPGSVAEGRLGLDKSSLYFPSSLQEVAKSLNFDPINRIRVEPITTATRITVVPKDWRGGRVIGMEPSWNMVLQQGVKSLLMYQTSHLVPYHDQGKQRARLYGVYELPLATVDLSNASDYVSVELAYDLIPGVWFDLLDRTRTPRYLLPDGTIHRTESIALMGNACCFPVLSCVTLVLALTSATFALGFSPSRTNLRILTQRYGIQTFGDDLVVPKECEHELMAVFAQAGLVVNHDKSGFGSFRETCGLFHFEGSSPFECSYLRYLDWNEDSYESLLSLENRLYDSGFPLTAQALAASAPQWVPGSKGLLFHVPFGHALKSRPLNPLNVRRDRRFHKWKLRQPKRATSTRTVDLCDQSGWFASFHGGIPVEEVTRLGPLLW